GHVDDRQRERDRPRLRADRRAAALARRVDRAHLVGRAVGAAQTGVRVELAAEGSAQVATGLPVLDHLVGELARCGGLRLTLEVSPGSAEEEVTAAGRALGAALAEQLRAPGASGRGWSYLPSEEALAGVVVEVAERPQVASNVDFSRQRVGGLASDV